MKRLWGLLLIVAMCLVPLGSFAEERTDYKIGISLPNADEFWFNQAMIYDEIAKTYEDLTLVSINAQSDAGKQLTDVETLIAQGCDAIIITGVDADACVASVEAIKAAGIICVVYENEPATDVYDVRVMGDNLDHGKSIGSYIQAWLDEDETRVCNMGYITGSTDENTNRRMTGIYETCTSDRLNTLITGVADWSPDKAMAMAEDWLLAYPNMNCIACANDEMAVAAIQAVKAAGKDLDDFLIFGVDGTVTGQEAIRNGEMDATSYQDSGIACAKNIEVALGLLNGKTYDKMVNPENYVLMTIDNIDEILGT